MTPKNRAGFQDQQRRLLPARPRATVPGMNEYGVVGIGGVAAGLSVALVLTRARRRVAVVGAENSNSWPGQESLD